MLFEKIDTEHWCQKEYFENDLLKYGERHEMSGKPNVPSNSFTVSMLPWTTFEGFHIKFTKRI